MIVVIVALFFSVFCRRDPWSVERNASIVTIYSHWLTPTRFLSVDFGITQNQTHNQQNSLYLVLCLKSVLTHFVCYFVLFFVILLPVEYFKSITVYVTILIRNLFRCLYVKTFRAGKCVCRKISQQQRTTKVEMKTKMISYAFIRVVIVFSLDCFDSPPCFSTLRLATSNSQKRNLFLSFFPRARENIFHFRSKQQQEKRRSRRKKNNSN